MMTSSHKLKSNFRYSILLFAISSILLSSCKDSPALNWTPERLTDTSDVNIIGDANFGNKGLLDYEGDVYVHVGLITDKSNNNAWRYVRFKWGSREVNAKATPLGKNKWSYSIPNIRKFFAVEKDERIVSIAILFRSGACVDVHCKVLRNLDASNMYIPIADETVRGGI
jgi:hypothetical protein